jgi:pseudoazurin
MKNYIFIFCFFVTTFDSYAAEYNVKMLNQGASGVMVFEPAVLKINKGDTVNFIATDPAHNSASLSGMIPKGAASWSSDLSKNISVTFDKEGVYAYQCTPHAVMAMVGVIQVGEDKSNLDEVKIAASNMSNMFVINKDRFTNYLNQL